MSTSEYASLLVGVNYKILSKEEIIFLEAELYFCIYEKLKEIFENKYKDYLSILKFDTEMENVMLEERFVRCIIEDIVATEEYTPLGIACYTQTAEDVILDIATGKNTNPSSQLLRKIIGLHRSVRPDLYREIMKKIILENQNI